MSSSCHVVMTLPPPGRTSNNELQTYASYSDVFASDHSVHCILPPPYTEFSTEIILGGIPWGTAFGNWTPHWDLEASLFLYTIFEDIWSPGISLKGILCLLAFRYYCKEQKWHFTQWKLWFHYSKSWSCADLNLRKIRELLKFLQFFLSSFEPEKHGLNKRTYNI